MEFRQASLRQAIADLLEGKEPCMENEAEVEFKAQAEAEDKMYAEQRAAEQAKKQAEQEAWQKNEHERLEKLAAQQAKKTKPKSKPKAKAVKSEETKEAAGQEYLVEDLARPNEDVAVKSLFWGLTFCCRQSEVLA